MCVSVGKELYPRASVQSGDEGVKKKDSWSWEACQIRQIVNFK